MPYGIYEESKGLRIVFHGFAAPFEFEEVARITAADPARQAHLYHLFEFVNIDSNSLFALTVAVAAAHAVRSRAIFGDRKRPKFTALVSPHSPIQAAFKAFIAGDPRPAGHRIERFTSQVAARQWLRECLAAEDG